MSPNTELRLALTTTAVPAELAAMVRRRVPPTEVADIVQEVMCDALSARAVPSSPGEIPRWLMAIAKHKIADFHRRSRRTCVAAQGHWSEVEDRGEAAVAAHPELHPAEERQLLQQILGEASLHSAQTLAWVFREHQGEQLMDIAREHGLSASNVRQRVSRFRKLMRSRYWLTAAVMALVVAGSASSHMVEVVRNAVSEGPATSTTRLSIEELTLPPGIDPATATALRAEARATSVVVRGKTVTVTTPFRTWSATLSLGEESAGKRVGTARLADGRHLPILVEETDTHFIVQLEEARIVLAR